MILFTETVNGNIGDNYEELKAHISIVKTKKQKDSYLKNQRLLKVQGKDK